MKKIIQISTGASYDDDFPVLYGLDNDGNLYELISNDTWSLVTDGSEINK